MQEFAIKNLDEKRKRNFAKQPESLLKRYEVERIGDSKGPFTASTVFQYMKP